MHWSHQGTGMTSPRTRERMIQRLKDQGIRSPEVLEAMRMIPRHLFVDEALASRAYEEDALPIGHGQTISQPITVARMTEALSSGLVLDTVLEIGTGSGYQAAILSLLARRVYSMERIGDLLVQARKHFRTLQLRNIHLKHSDGTLGLPEYSPFDGIIVTAAPEGVPESLLEQLKLGGRLVLPTKSRNGQFLVRITRTEHGYDRETLDTANFVPLLGGIY